MTRIGAMLKREVLPAHLIVHAQRHQDAFDELWVVEDLPYAGGISQAAAVLASTTNVVVGHGIAPAPFRNAAALAMEWATLAEMFPERFIGGLGHGVQSWMGDVGARPTSPLTLLREVHDVVQTLLSGEEVDFDGTYVTINGQRLEFPPQFRPPVLLGVLGPRSLELSGEIAAGTILPEGHGPEEIAAARKHIARGALRSGKNPAEHQLVVFASFHVGGSETMAERNPEAPTAWEALGADPAAVAAKLQSLIDVGVDSIVLVSLATDLDAQLELAAREILPTLIT